MFTQWKFDEELPHRTYSSYFKLFFPAGLTEPIITSTNTELHAIHQPILSHEEFFRYIGMRYMMTEDPLDNVDDYWKVKADPNSNQIPRAYGVRFQISKHRFEHIEQCLSWTSTVDEVRKLLLFSLCK